MFRTHQKEISQYAQSGPDQMARVITFVYLTIQQSILTLPEQMRSVDREGTESRFLWGFKLGAYEWLSENKESVYRSVMDTWRGHADPAVAERETLSVFASMPGLGLVKGGFCNQLIFGTTGCIDSHNMKRFGIPESAFHASRFKRAGAKTRQRLLREYADTCADFGGAEGLWDDWCELVGQKYGKTAHEISALHLEAIKHGA